jgi:tetratricopeptide (TPR) repeat protein
MTIKRFPAVLLLLILASPSFAADKWVSVRSRNFTLVGNAGESDIRRAGRTLEEFRSAMAELFPKMGQTPQVPTTIVVFKNDESFKPYKPLYNGQPSNTLAFFQPGEDANYIALTATLPSPNVILHEYVHFLLRENVGSLPLWVSEGLAECYSTFDLGGKQNEFTIGRAPEQHIATLNMTPQFIPLKRLLAIQPGSPEYNESSKQGMFYAESWSIVHYLMFGADGKRRMQFTEFLTDLLKGETFENSFGQAFQTDYGTLESEVREYVRKRASWPMVKVTSKEPIQSDTRAMTATTLGEGESEYYLGDLLRHLNRLGDAETHLNAAISKTPNAVDPVASLALLRVQQKKYDEALSLLKKAAETDSKNPMIDFFYAYVLERADADVAAAVSAPPDRVDTIRNYAAKAIDRSPRYVESYALLARVDLTAGEHLDEAEAALKKAIAIAPGRDDLQMLLGQTYLRANRIDDARGVLSVVERSTSNADYHRQAAALLQQTQQGMNFTDITQLVEKEAREQTAQSQRPAQTQVQMQLQPAAPPAPGRNTQDTVLEALTPIAPTVEGEKVTGLLTNLDCSDGLTLQIRTDRNTLQLHSSNPDRIQFLSYTADVGGNIKCGPRNPGTPVTVTYRPVQGGLGDPLVIEFQEKK